MNAAQEIDTHYRNVMVWVKYGEGFLQLFIGVADKKKLIVLRPIINQVFEEEKIKLESRGYRMVPIGPRTKSRRGGFHLKNKGVVGFFTKWEESE